MISPTRGELGRVTRAPAVFYADRSQDAPQRPSGGRWCVFPNEPEECFIVRDATGQALGYFYYDDEPHRRSVNRVRRIKVLTLFLLR